MAKITLDVTARQLRRLVIEECIAILLERQVFLLEDNLQSRADEIHKMVLSLTALMEEGPYNVVAISARERDTRPKDGDAFAAPLASSPVCEANSPKILAHGAVNV